MAVSTRRSSTRQTTLSFGNVKRGADEAEGKGKGLQLRKRAREGNAEEGAGTTTDASQLHPVTNASFLNAYKVQGIDDVYYNPGWISSELANDWHDQLDKLLEWYRPKLRVYGREITQSRAIAAFSTAPGLTLKYSGHDVEMHSPFPPLLQRIAAQLCDDRCLGSDVKFNHAMLNKYGDGSVYIGRHSDNVENKVIVTVSLGAERSWIMEEKVPRKSHQKGRRHRWTLGNGSVLVMQGNVQRAYTHEIPKEPKVNGSRISITFRQLVY